MIASQTFAPLRPCRYAAPLRGRPPRSEGLAQPNKQKILIYSCPHMEVGIHLITQSDLSKVTDQHTNPYLPAMGSAG